MRSRAEPINADLLARHLAERISRHTGNPIDLLTGLSAALTAPYHKTLQQLEQRARQHGALAPALLEQTEPSLQQLGQLLQTHAGAALAPALADWLQNRARLQHIGALVRQLVDQQLGYFLTLLSTFCVISLIWLMYVAPTYNELFSELAGHAHAPSFSQLLLALADSEHPLIAGLKLLLLLLPFFAGALAWLATQQMKRLQHGQSPWRRTGNWPVFRQFSAVQALFDASNDTALIQPLLSPDEQLELKLAKQGGYLSAQLDSLRKQPEAVLAARVAKPLKRLIVMMTLMLWLAIASFLVAAYQPIFSLGAAV